MSDLKQRAEQLVSSGLKGLGEKKLSELDLELLIEIVKQLGDDVPEEANVEGLVKTLLKKKRNKQVLCKATTPARPVSPIIQSHARESGIFKKKHSIEFIAFNALKLRVFREDLKEQFKMLVERFAMSDVIVMSEVSNVERAKEFLSYLQVHGEWTLRTSPPSKPMNEIHAVFVKASIQVLRHVTTVSVGVHEFAHAPFTLLLEDQHLGRFVVSSVHFPPQNKAPERDAQIKAFIKAYTEESALRCDTPFTEKGARDAKTKLPVHVIAGDFNCWPGAETYNIEARGFTALLGKHVSTTSGNQAFDNAIVTENARNMFAISSSVLELSSPQRSCKGEIGLSDHSPIVFKFEM